MVASAPLLRCRALRKTFPGVVALDDVHLEVAAGTIHALVGENGAGKSTLVKILSGAQPPDAGRVELAGRHVQLTDPRAAQRLGVAIVYQDFNLVPDLSVSENIFLGRWPTFRGTGLIDFNALHARAEALLASLGISLPVRRLVSSLSVAHRQMVEIVKALSLDARLLMLDEPSAVLTPHELESLFTLLRDLTRRGVAVIYISHRLDEIFDLADHVTVLRDGRHISTRPVSEVSRASLIAEMVGRELADEFPSRDAPIGDTVLTLDRLSVDGRFHDVSLEVRAGEVLALTGLIGAGRSSVLKTVFGAVPATSGRVRVGKADGPFASPRAAMAAGVAFLPEDRKQEGLLIARSIRENTTIADLSAVSRAGILLPQAERAVTAARMAELQIKAVGPESAVETLSGGNQQKVLLGRWMGRPHRVVLFDEPTRGVDVGAKFEIYTLINRLAGEGVAVVLATSELPEAIGMADRIAVMHEGACRGVLENGARQVSQEAIMRLATGERLQA